MRRPLLAVALLAAAAATAALCATPATAARGRCNLGDTALTHVGCRTTCATSFQSCSRFARERSCRSWFFKRSCCRFEAGPVQLCPNVGVPLHRCYCARGGLRIAGIVLLVLTAATLVAAAAAAWSLFRRRATAAKARSTAGAADGTAPDAYAGTQPKADGRGGDPTTVYPPADNGVAYPAGGDVYPAAPEPAYETAAAGRASGGYPPVGGYGVARGGAMYNTRPAR